MFGHCNKAYLAKTAAQVPNKNMFPISSQNLAAKNVAPADFVTVLDHSV